MFAIREEVRDGIEAFNRLLQEAWASRTGELAQRLADAATGMEADELVEKVESLELDVRQPPSLSLDGALAGPGRLEILLAAPAAGAWSLDLRARIRPGGIFGRRTFQVRVQVQRVRVVGRLSLERISELEARFLDSGVEVVLEGARLDSSNFLLRLLLRNLLNPLLRLLRREIDQRLRQELEGSLPQAEAVRAIAALGLAAAPVVFAGEAPALAAVHRQASSLAERIAAELKPSGSVLDGLDGVQAASPRAFDHFHDSAIWTGHYLAGEVLRGLAGDAAALARSSRAIDSLEFLASLTPRRGLLSRVLVRADDLPLVENLRRAEHADRIFPSSDGRFFSQGHISRDQYAGAFLGLGLAALLLGEDRAADRDKARAVFLDMAGYLVENQFCAEEAVPSPSGFAFTATTWTLDPFQVLAIVRTAARLDPERFDPVFRRLRPLATIAWIFLWLETLDPNGSYYKFNLEHSLALLLAEAEPDPAERRFLLQGFRVVRHALRFHANGWFNVVELAVAGGDDALLSRPRQEIERETRHLLAGLLERPALIEQQEIAWPAERKVEIRDLAGREKETIANAPVDVPRRPGTDFLWQRSPFSLRVVWSLDKLHQTWPGLFWRPPGIDLTLPAALARRLEL